MQRTAASSDALFPSPNTVEETHSCPASTLLHHTTVFLLLFTLQVLLLLFGRHTTKKTLAVLLLDLLGCQFALLGLLILIDTTQLLDLLFASVPDLASHLRAEVSGADETISETQELGE